MNITVGLKDIINLIKQERKEQDDDKVVVIDAYNMKITEDLIRQEHNRRVNIHNLDEYINLCNRNDKRMIQLNEVLSSRHHGKEYQTEVLKEIALEQILKKLTINDVEKLMDKYQQL